MATLLTSSVAIAYTVASSATSVVLLPANPQRLMATFYNNSTQILYLKFAAVSSTSTTSYTVQLGAGDYYELPQPVHLGIISGIWASANGNCQVTELQ